MIICSVLVLVVTMIGFLFITQQNKNSVTDVKNGFTNEQLIEIFRNYGEDSIELDIFFEKISVGELSGSDIFNSITLEKLQTELTSVQRMQKTLGNKEAYDEDINEILKTLESKLSSDVKIYEEAFAVYNDFYDAISEKDPTKIQRYISMENLDSIIKEYTEYINNLPQIEVLEKNYSEACPSTLEVLPKQCNNILIQLFGLTAPIENTEYLSQIFIFATTELFDDEAHIATLITKIMDSLGV